MITAQTARTETACATARRLLEEDPTYVKTAYEIYSQIQTAAQEERTSISVPMPSEGVQKILSLLGFGLRPKPTNPDILWIKWA